jgi:hypothetical protein
MHTQNHSTTVKWLAGAAVAAVCLGVTCSQLVAAKEAAGGLAPDARTQPTRDESAISGPRRTVTLARADRVRDALGFPAATRTTARHVRDGFQRTDYDEVQGLDEDGQPLWLTQLDSAGRLLDAVRLDQPGRVEQSVSRAAATGSASRAATAAGLTIAGAVRAEPDPASSGWTVHWLRSQQGVPVRGDETRVQVWPDGRIGAASRVEHELAAPPARQLSGGEADAAGRRVLDAWFGGKPSSYSVQGLDLEWVGPNGTFDPAKPLEPEPVYRLAWVVNVKPSGAAAQYAALITLYLDAGDGSLLGGDVVE